VALANPANYPMTDTSPNTLYGFAFHSHALGTTTALLPSHEPVESETDFTGSPHRSSLSAVPYRRNLLCPRGQETTWDFTGLDVLPLSPSDSAHHPNSQGGYPYPNSPRISAEAEKPASPSGRKLAGSFRPKRSPSEQRWPASSLRPIAGAHWLRSPGAELPPEFCQRFLHKYGLAQVGLSLC